jgi:hypothetical protein
MVSRGFPSTDVGCMLGRRLALSRSDEGCRPLWAAPFLCGGCSFEMSLGWRRETVEKWVASLPKRGRPRAS